MTDGSPIRGPVQVFDSILHFPSGGLCARRKTALTWSRRIVLALLLFGVIFFEIRTSTIEAWLLTYLTRHLAYEMGPGPNPRAVFPNDGPYDQRHGYAQIPRFQSRLLARHFRIAEQARVSPALRQLIGWGIAPPYREPARTGLAIRSADGKMIYQANSSAALFLDFQDLPPLLARTVLFIENQQLDRMAGPYMNPVIEWERLAKAGFLYAASWVGLSHSVQGGSTLATQIEKFRHSPQGRTHSIADKARQIIGASLKAYREGADTRPRRREIVVDYLNSVPLSAAPGYGEVNGLGEGLYVWFGLEPQKVWQELRAPNFTPAKVTAYKHVTALLVSLRAPTTLLLKNRAALERRTNGYIRLLESAGVIEKKFADALVREPLRFASDAPVPSSPSFRSTKAADRIRISLLGLLGVPDLYSLDRLHLEVESTIDSALQTRVDRLFRSITDRDFVRAHGLDQEKLLRSVDPQKVAYSLLLYERTPEGNLLRVQSDNLDRPFDLNSGMKLELGSTAKLRVLAHYLEIVALLYQQFSSLDPGVLASRATAARDPITQWAAETLAHNPHLSLSALLDRALERRYSASPYEAFFTGGGRHTFENFDPRDNARILTVREGFQRSTNLVFIRLMRDLVRFHEARLPYDAAAVLYDTDHPLRRRFLEQSVEAEAKIILRRAYEKFRGLSADEVIERLLGARSQSPRHRAILYFAWHRGGDPRSLGRWLEQRIPVTPEDVSRLYRAYSHPHLNVADFGYLLSLHPLQVWCAGELAQKPNMSWEELLSRSAEARRISYAWLFRPRHIREQNLRLRARIERDAFARMTPYWRRLGFPFDPLVPSYATAIGSSSDRPSALAELMGIIVNDGVRRPARSLSKIRFAAGTPYETALENDHRFGERVMRPEVARALKDALARVVEKGTAGRLRGTFTWPDGSPVKVGGKTGSGDNRLKTFNRYGHLTSSRAVSRTAAFVFYIGDRYYGVVTTWVAGAQAGGFSFTSALPVTVTKMLAPAINARLKDDAQPPGDSPRLLRIQAGEAIRSTEAFDRSAALNDSLKNAAQRSERGPWSRPQFRLRSQKATGSTILLPSLGPPVRAPPS
ncbi:MAG TPA: transglycosylase domain-containing protein [Candidatus Binatia bacterium]|nr:transglycosylase domain-containing protein [Candidatus Binatia bacterium]